MYEAFFGLRNRPFSPLPRVENYIPLAPVREPFEALVRCVNQEQGIGVLTAPSGAGKSLVCRLLQQRFSDQCRTILLTTARFPTRRALLQAILFELKHPFIGLSEQEARLRVLDLLQASPAPQHRMLLIVDEAHLLSARGLEELRTLTDYEIAGTPCVSLVLSGQLELEELLTSPEMNAFNQRIGCHACIEPLTFEESSQYLRERLRYAGNNGLTIFTPEAVQLICSASEGNPRRLNQLSDHSLLLAYAEETRPVDVSVVRSALLDLRELPLHWNAPLDLTWTTDQNPLEKFAEAHADHAADEAELLDDSLTECDTDIEVDDPVAFETSAPDSGSPVSDSSSSVYEVGAPLDASSLEQLFEATRFIVPGEQSYSAAAPSWPADFETSLAPSTHAFETAPPTGIDTGDTTSGDEGKDQLMFTDAHLTPEGESGQASTHHAAPPSSAVVTPASLRGEYVEWVVDDAYAAIDRQLESSLPHWTPPVHVQAWEELPPTPAPEMEVVFEDIDDTLFAPAPISESQASPADFEFTITEVHPMLDESQLLDLINEISVGIRQFRSESDASQAVDNLDLPSVTGDEDSLRPRHQSLRQSLNWQYDIVEPEPAKSLPEQPCHDPQWQASIESQPAIHGTTESAEASTIPIPVAPIIDSGEAKHTPNERPFAQLFTRLQRQRRRVETVMSRDR